MTSSPSTSVLSANPFHSDMVGVTSGYNPACSLFVICQCSFDKGGQAAPCENANTQLLAGCKKGAPKMKNRHCVSLADKFTVHCLAASGTVALHCTLDDTTSS
eukprot:m.46656 g.46656  ORF g.46656 m.46656 type:complete len:103 (-) comp15177_c0_seq1:579-887(-)